MGGGGIGRRGCAAVSTRAGRPARRSGRPRALARRGHTLSPRGRAVGVAVHRRDLPTLAGGRGAGRALLRRAGGGSFADRARGGAVGSASFAGGRLGSPAQSACAAGRPRAGRRAPAVVVRVGPGTAATRCGRIHRPVGGLRGSDRPDGVHRASGADTAAARRRIGGHAGRRGDVAGRDPVARGRPPRVAGHDAG